MGQKVQRRGWPNGRFGRKNQLWRVGSVHVCLDTCTQRGTSLKVCCEEYEPSTQERFREEDHARGTCGRQVVLGRIEGSDKDGTSLPISWLDHLSSSMLEKNVISYEVSKAESKCDAVRWDGCSCFRNYHSLLFTLPSLFMRQ